MMFLDAALRSAAPVSAPPRAEVRAAEVRATAVPAAGWATAPGPRTVCADAAAARTCAAGFAVAVADGIGDTPGAAAAARIAADAAVHAAASAGARGAVRAAQLALRAARDADREIGDAVLAVAVGDAGRGWSVSWVGDCRAYFVSPGTGAQGRAGQAQQLTTDHTVAEYLRARGVHPGARLEHVVTSTVATVGPDGIGQAPGPGGAGRLVLVTDGVHRTLDARAIAAIVRTVADPAAAARWLTRAALAAGGHDDVGAVVTDLP